MPHSQNDYSSVTEESTAVIKFDQNKLVSYVISHPDELPDFYKINKKFNGLCELICNYILLKDLMGNQVAIPVEPANPVETGFALEWLPDGKTVRVLNKSQGSESHYEREINLFNLEQEGIIHTHILNNFSIFRRIAARFFNIFPLDLFSCKTAQINQQLLISGLKKLKDNSYIKFMLFNKHNSFKGHSLLIKKTGNLFSFFDPNEGEFPDLDIDQLCSKIDSAISHYKFDHMVFLDGKKFARIISDTAKKKKSSRILSEHQVACRKIMADEIQTIQIEDWKDAEERSRTLIFLSFLKTSGFDLKKISVLEKSGTYKNNAENYLDTRGHCDLGYSLYWEANNILKGIIRVVENREKLIQEKLNKAIELGSLEAKLLKATLQLGGVNFDLPLANPRQELILIACNKENISVSEIAGAYLVGNFSQDLTKTIALDIKARIPDITNLHGRRSQPFLKGVAKILSEYKEIEIGKKIGSYLNYCSARVEFLKKIIAIAKDSLGLIKCNKEVEEFYKYLVNLEMTTAWLRNNPEESNAQPGSSARKTQKNDKVDWRSLIPRLVVGLLLLVPVGVAVTALVLSMVGIPFLPLIATMLATFFHSVITATAVTAVTAAIAGTGLVVTTVTVRDAIAGDFSYKKGAVAIPVRSHNLQF